MLSTGNFEVWKLRAVKGGNGGKLRAVKWGSCGNCFVCILNF